MSQGDVYCRFQVNFLDGPRVIGSTQQTDVREALRALLGVAAPSNEAAFPVATADISALMAELDDCIAPEVCKAFSMACC